MARPTLYNHRKFRRLVRALGNDVIALGSLEWLWASAYELGEPLLGDSDDVEAAAHWTGEPGILTKALLLAGGEGDKGFIEQAPGRGGRYLVHDFWDHAPEYVRKRRIRETERTAKGRRLSGETNQDSDTCPDRVQTESGQRPPNDGHVPPLPPEREDSRSLTLTLTHSHPSPSGSRTGTRTLVENSGSAPQPPVTNPGSGSGVGAQRTTAPGLPPPPARRNVRVEDFRACHAEVRRLLDQIAQRIPAGDPLWGRVKADVHELGTACTPAKTPLLGFPEDLATELFAWLERQGMATIAANVRRMAVGIPESPSTKREAFPRVSAPGRDPESGLRAALSRAGIRPLTPQRLPTAPALRSIARAARAMADAEGLSADVQSIPLPDTETEP